MSGPLPLAVPLPRVVVGARLRLEVWQHDRVEEVRSLVERSRPQLSEFLPWAVAGLLSDEEEARFQSESYERWREGYMAGWAVVEDGGVRGMLGLHRRGGPHELEIGYWLGTEWTGRGLMTEAARMATDVAFDQEGVELVEILHDAANARSAAVPRRLGYARTAAMLRPLDPSLPHGTRETGLKVRWVERRDRWLARRGERAALSTEP